MVLEAVRCSVCDGIHVTRYGKTEDGKQRYICRNKACSGKTFIGDYSELERLPEVKEQIMEMNINGSGIRAIARGLKISPTIVIEELKKRISSATCKSDFGEATEPF